MAHPGRDPSDQHPHLSLVAANLAVALNLVPALWAQVEVASLMGQHLGLALCLAPVEQAECRLRTNLAAHNSARAHRLEPWAVLAPWEAWAVLVALELVVEA